MTALVGHRGGRNLWPENSLTGFRNALALDLEAIEFDVHLTDAGELVVIHDATLDRTAEASGEVRALTPEDRARITLKGTSDGIPTLDEVLALFAGAKPIELHVELKADASGTPYAGLEALTAAAIERHGLAGRSLLTSFNPDVLDECRRVAPAIERLISINDRSAQRLGLVPTLERVESLVRVVAVHKDLLASQWDEITAIIPRERICAWVLNERAELEHWLSRGVGFITSDEPVLALDVREAQAAA